MGNSQSGPEDQKQARVSKPKTFNSSRTSAVICPLESEFGEKATIPTLPYAAFEDLESARASPIKVNRSQQDFRNVIRSQLLAPTETKISEPSEKNQLGLMAVTVARSLSRSGPRGPIPRSSLAKLQGGESQLSVASERSVDLETAVALLHELRKTASPDDLVALHQALLPKRSPDGMSSTYESAGEAAEEALGTSAAALIRRKSLAAPGVATRKAKNEESMPPQDPGMSIHDQLWQRDMMHDSPLAVLSNMDSTEPPAPSEGNRCPTPGDMDYSHLGSLKIGSLVVTNGCVSPNPSFVSRDFSSPKKPSTDRYHEDLYYTASEGGSAHEDIDIDLPTLPPIEPKHPLPNPESKGSFDPPRTPDRASRPELPTRRSGSPLKQVVRAESLNYGCEALHTQIRQPRPAASAISLAAFSENHSLLENTSSDEEYRPAHTRARAESAISLASEYMAEMPPSPYGTPPRHSRDLPRRPSRVSSELPNSEEYHEALPNHSGELSLEQSDNRPNLQHHDQLEDTIRHFDQKGQEAQIVQTDEKANQDFGRGTPKDFAQTSADIFTTEFDEVYGSAELPLKEEILAHTALRSHPPMLKSALRVRSFGSGQAKTDSGYSSGSSNYYEAEQMKPHTMYPSYEAEQPRLSTGYPAYDSEQVRCSLVHQSVEGPASSGAEKHEHHVVQRGYFTKDNASFRGRPPTRDKPTQILDDPTPEATPEKIERSKSWRKSVRKSLPRMLSSNSSPTSIKSSTPETKSAGKAQRKLQKKRPLSQPPIAFGQKHDLIDGDVPCVPSAVSSRFSMRLAQSPGMEHLERTYDSPSASSSRGGSQSPSPAVRGGSSVPASYFPDASVENLTAGKVKRLSRAINTGATPPTPSRLISFNKRDQRSSGPARDDDDEIIGVADFGTVAQSLGGSPYDIAMNANSDTRRFSSTPTQPHQMSTGSRLGPREGWDAKTASQFAQMRSRDRAATSGRGGYGRPTMGNRPSSYQDRPSTYYDQTPQQGWNPQKQYQVSNIVQPRPRSTPGNEFGSHNSNFEQHKVQHEPMPTVPRPRPTSSYTVTTQPLITTMTVSTSGVLPLSATTISTQAPRSSTLITQSHAPRSPSPVKSLVNAFEQRSIGSPSGSPKPADSYDWSEHSRLWRERRMQAHTTVQSSATSNPVTNTNSTTFTTVTTFSPASSPSPAPRTPGSVVTLPPTPDENPSGNLVEQKRTSPFKRPSPQVLPQSHLKPQSRRLSKTPEPSPISVQKKSLESKFEDHGIFGRYGGGFRHRKDKTMSAVTPPAGKREVTPRTGAVRREYGVDLGDVPTGR
ncbi:hypothetical protein EJ08DRAFT_692940 [Tothia fuscella]|uniref:Uncharacterized protein n=1 Tax=Tothia fuscella TaxID=1048955 RepID=A0A9P4P1Q2_9PEZI|nr:hypothetical protein EJ08DRAFT_692940 [Tothia fuscella]